VYESERLGGSKRSIQYNYQTKELRRQIEKLDIELQKKLIKNDKYELTAPPEECPFGQDWKPCIKENMHAGAFFLRVDTDGPEAMCSMFFYNTMFSGDDFQKMAKIAHGGAPGLRKEKCSDIGTKLTGVKEAIQHSFEISFGTGKERYPGDRYPDHLVFDSETYEALGKKGLPVEQMRSPYAFNGAALGKYSPVHIKLEFYQFLDIWKGIEAKEKVRKNPLGVLKDGEAHSLEACG